MSYLIGYISSPFIISFLLVYFIGRKRYLKKNGEEMSKGKIVGFTAGIGVIMLVLSLIGGSR